MKLLAGSLKQQAFEMNLMRNSVVLFLVTVSLSTHWSEGADEPVFEPEWNKGALSIKFYSKTCPQGCDASILLDSIPTQAAEKDAPPNLNSLRGYEVYDAIKAALEQPAVCPGVVSCADIIALVARDSVNATSGTYWPIYLGRRDGLVSSSTEAVNDLPGPTSTYPQLMSAFAAVGLSQHDLVTLSGAHTIGRSQCANFMTRLYNYSGQGITDPSLNTAYAGQLKQKCPPNSPTSNLVPMDSTEFVFDKNYYEGLTNNKGLFNSDVQLLTKPFPASIVADYVANGDTSFFPHFTVSMQRMLVANVLTGSQGEIRANCRVINS